MLARMVLISWHRDPPASASQSAGITGLSHRAQPVVLIHMFQRTNDIEYLFICLLAIFLYFFREITVQIFCPFLICFFIIES